MPLRTFLGFSWAKAWQWSVHDTCSRFRATGGARSSQALELPELTGCVVSTTTTGKVYDVFLNGQNGQIMAKVLMYAPMTIFTHNLA